MPDPNQLPPATPTIDAFLKSVQSAPAPEPEKQPNETTAAPEGHQEATQASPAPAAKEPEPRLAQLIREGRESREARTKADAEAKSLRDELAQAKATIAKLSKMDIVSDPIGYAQAVGLSKEEQAAIGEAYLYDIVPERAPADWRTKMAEMRDARSRKMAEAEGKRQAEEAEKARVAETRNQYANALHASVQKIPEGSYQDSKAWFGGDHVNYTRSLLATAENLAEAARQRGEMADLSFDAVAKVLEADIKSRFDRRSAARSADKPAAGGQTQQKPAEPATGKQPGETTSTKGLTGTAAPRPPAQTEAERMARALAVLEGRI